MELSRNPISNVKWIKASKLNANLYNPNYVYKKELDLLALSIIKTGWLQPIIIDTNNVIIDGYHRCLLVKTNPKVAAITDGHVPCAILNIPEKERVMFTVRINRAKGFHIAIKMADVVKKLTKLGTSAAEMKEGMGMTAEEIDLLLQENVFTKLKVEKTPYSMGWVPADAGTGETERDRVKK